MCAVAYVEKSRKLVLVVSPCVLQLSKLSLTSVDGETPSALTTHDTQYLADVNKEDVQYEITVLEEKLAQMKPNMAAIAEYKKKVCASK